MPEADSGTAASPTTAGRSRNMAAIRRRDTGPERLLRSILHARGLRYRVDVRMDLPGGRVRPDLVFTRARVAVFVDGCFWHSCPVHGRKPTMNVAYWVPKLEGNVARDIRSTAALQDQGWRVMRFWEHESPVVCAGLVERAVLAQAGSDRGTRAAPVGDVGDR